MLRADSTPLGTRICQARVLAGITNHPRHEFWPDSIPYHNVRVARVIGHRQVTEAYLAELARSHGGRLAILDQGFAALHGDVVDLIPAESTGR